MSVKTDAAMINGKPWVDFIRFVIPSILGLVAVSSAGVVDGLFVGNYVGAAALAAVNLVMPVYSLFFGLCVMMLVGGAVIAGKYLGRNEHQQASNIFTKSMIVVMTYAVVLGALGFLFAEPIAEALGAQQETLPLTALYIKIISPFMPFMGLGYALSYFARVDDAPTFSLVGLLIAAVVNVILDALFIGAWGWGIEGAAFASGIGYTLSSLFLMTHFLGKNARIKVIKPFGEWSELFRAAYNGFSEFINEMSGGLMMFVINWILMIEAGTTGVAAFTIVNYILWLSIMVGYGTAEALGPLISVNFGARKPERIAKFVKLGVGLTCAIGVAFAVMLLTIPEVLASAFINSSETQTLNMTLMIISVIWPAFLFNGINICLSGYFTGMHAGTQSAMIAMSRSLVCPLVLIILFWKAFGLDGAFIAIPMAEAITFVLSIALFYKATPRLLIAKDIADS